MPKLSIITINYNNVDGLKKTIESVINQISTDFEYIVIDGDSTDDSVEVIKQYSDKISYWVSEPDSGIYNAMNKGIRKAKGEYCQFLNSGDFLVNTSVIARMLEDIPNCSVYVGNMLKLLPGGKIYQDKGNTNNELTVLNFYRGTINHSPAFIKRNLFAKYGLYDESLKIVSDWKFYFITVGLNNEVVRYKDLDVTCFDMNGISTLNSDLDKTERKRVLKKLLPSKVLADYDNHWQEIEQIRRIKRYTVTKWLFWFVERCLFKFEKWLSFVNPSTIKLYD